MNNMHFVDAHGNYFERVSRRTARRLFEEDRPLAICPVKQNPRGPLGYAYTKKSECNEGTTLDDLALWCECMCCNSELGYYPAFYVGGEPAISIRAPRFSQGAPGLGYVTADTMEVYVNGYRLKCSEWSEELQRLARLVNAGEASHDSVHAILDPVARALVGRVAW